MWEQFSLTGESVELRPLVLDDAEALAEAARESRDTFTFTPVPDGVEDARFYIERTHQAQAAGTRLPLAIAWNGRAVGSSSFLSMTPWLWPAGSPLQRTAEPDSVEIGATWLAASAQRTRCNTEAKLLMLSHAFEVWDVYSVRFRTDARNERSRRAIERLGAQLEGVLRSDYPGNDARPRNSASYSILAAEWPGVRERLEARLRA